MGRKSLQIKPLIRLFHGASFPGLEVLAEAPSIEPHEVSGPADIGPEEIGVLVLDRSLRQSGGDVLRWKHGRTQPLPIIGERGMEHADFFAPDDWEPVMLLKALESACRELNLLLGKKSLHAQLDHEHDKLFQLTHIGLALSAERDLDRLLTKILTEGRRWACCDAASLFLLDRTDEQKPELLFKLIQNDSVDCPFEEQRFPLDKKSIAGFVAVTGDILNLSDVYQLPEEKPFHFNRSFDESINYRTRSILAIPMKNHNQEVLGVLQFINRKTDPDIRLTSRGITERHTMAFTQDVVVLLKALASQAAVAIGNTLLVQQIQDLFHGFVKASVKAIEQRDETTKGHSSRVANLTTSLALSLSRSGYARFKNTRFSEREIKEIRYASLLHDFGKVGVRESVLTKEKKLAAGGLDLIRYRFMLQKERLRHQAAEQRLAFILRHGKQAYQARAAQFEQDLEQDLLRFERFFEQIERAQEPTILPNGYFQHLKEIRDLPPLEVDGRSIRLLDDDEFLALSVRKGTLTDQERREIEDHVVHTYDFLKMIPWTRELKRIPEIARAHHEKLDGSGYPHGWKGDQIPVESRMMTVADIYDALTASDRPYKKSLPAERALEILENEVQNNLIDPDLVQIFIEAKIYENAESSDETAAFQGPTGAGFQRGVCDHD